MRGRLVGNFPQAFSHIGLVNTAYNLIEAHGPARQRSERVAPTNGDSAADAMTVPDHIADTRSHVANRAATVQVPQKPDGTAAAPNTSSAKERKRSEPASSR